MNYTVNQVAQMAGVSIRTLHHYDAIGLLKPAVVGENGYRYYSNAELARLQQILINRELGLSLAEIGQLLDQPGFERLTALKRQRDRLETQARRYAAMIQTINQTIAALKGEHHMKDADLYNGIVSPEKQAEYESWLEQKYGPEIRNEIERGKDKVGKFGEGERSGLMEELAAIEKGLAQAMQRAVPADSGELDPLLVRHHTWVSTMWSTQPTGEAYSGLAELYLSHPDFVSRYEQIAPGFAHYLSTAMKSWAGRNAATIG